MSGGFATLGLALVSVLASVASVFFTPVLRLFGMTRFGNILTASALYSVPVWLWTAVGVLAYANLSRNPARPRTLRRVFGVAFNGGRFLPLIVFFGVGLPFAFAAMLALMVNVTDVLVSFSARDMRWVPTREWWLSMAIAFALQGAFVLHYMDESFVAAFATAAASAAMLALLLMVGLASPDPGSNYRKCVSSAAVALALTAYFSYSGRGYLAGGYSSIAPPPGVPTGGKGPLDESAEIPPAAIGDGGFYGVVLWPELEKQTRLVAPLPVWQGASRGELRSPTTIPFSGEYWMYRLPYKQPPRFSYKRRGSPAKLFFKTTRGDPLMMEAKQKLDLPIAINCCDRIRLSIHDADPHPASVALELVLIDSSTTPPRTMSLGRNMIGLEAVEEIDFAIPRRPVLREFNEIQVIFHRDRLNHSRSARIAIDRFVLMPKGA